MQATDNPANLISDYPPRCEVVRALALHPIRGEVVRVSDLHPPRG